MFFFFWGGGGGVYELYYRIVKTVNAIKVHCHGDFSSLFNKVGLKPWLSAITQTQNTPRTSRKRYQVIRMLKERGTVVHFNLFSFKLKWLEKAIFHWTWTLLFGFIYVLTKLLAPASSKTTYRGGGKGYTLNTREREIFTALSNWKCTFALLNF